MPIEDYQLAAGNISKSTLQGSATYTISSFALASDMGTRAWAIPGDDSTFPQPARIVRTADGNSRADGYYEWTWVWDYLTEGQLAALDTLLSWTDSAWSSACTVQLRMPDGGFDCYQAIAHRPEPRSLKRSERGFVGVSIRFTNGVLL